MFQLGYLSLQSNLFKGDSTIDDILNTAKKFNSENDITGMLVFRGGVFLQLLEGDKDQVLNLFGRIASDLRHESIRVVIKQNSEERIFPHWTMAYKKLEDMDLEAVNKIIPWKDITEVTKEGHIISNKKITELFKYFRFSLQ